MNDRVAEWPLTWSSGRWVELERELPTVGAAPVLDDVSFGELLRQLDVALNPTAFA